MQRSRQKTMMKGSPKSISSKIRGAVIAAFVALHISPTLVDAQEQDVIKLFDEYLALFNAGDSESIANSIFSAPIHYAGDWTQNTWQTEEEVTLGFDEIFNNLRDTGWSKSVHNLNDICIASDSLAFVTLTYSYLNVSGEPIPPTLRTGMYVAVQTPDGWRIYAGFDYDQRVQLDCN
jgi:hypothetical protein